MLGKCSFRTLVLDGLHKWMKRNVRNILSGIFGPKRDEVTEEWRKLHNEELHNLYSTPDIIRQVK
jgi:hypothetical protein